MGSKVNLRKFLAIFFAGLMLTACATQVKKESTGMIQGDVYTGTDTV